MAGGRQMASRPKVLPSTAPEDVADVDEDQVLADEQAAAARARTARPRRASSPTLKSVPAPKPAPAKAPAKRKPSAKRPSSSRSTKTVPARAAGAAHDGAGVVLGMVGYALFLAYVKGGWTGVTHWLGAKFLNNTPKPTPPVDPRQTTPQTGAGGGPGIFNVTPPPGSETLPG